MEMTGGFVMRIMALGPVIDIGSAGIRVGPGYA
jgi:hypothetical protein